MPSYAELMTEADGSGREWSYLASDKNYAVVRDLELRNLIVPLTGDFGGPKAIRAVGQYVKDHGSVVSAFYTSNVEGYLFQGGDRSGNPNGGAAKFYANVSTLPLDKTSTFIRWIPRWGNTRNGDSSMRLASIMETLEEFESGQFSEDNLLLPAYGNRFGRGLDRIGDLGGFRISLRKKDDGAERGDAEADEQCHERCDGTRSHEGPLSHILPRSCVSVRICPWLAGW